MNDKRPLHVLQIAPGDLWAGAEVQLYNLAVALHNRTDCKVSVILLNHSTLEKQLKRAGIGVKVIDENTCNSLEILRSLIRLTRELQPDLVHTHRTKINIFGSIAAYLSGNIPSVKTSHGSQEHPPSFLQFSKRLIFFVEWFCGRFLQKKVIAVSENLAGILETDYPPGKIHVIENGIDSEPLACLRDKTPSRSCDKQCTYNIGTAGRLVPIKRFDVFIEFAHLFKQRYPDIDIRFRIFGDGPLRDELEALNTRLGPNDIVVFEGHCENMPQRLLELDALIMTSDHEGLPMILLEAMSLQIPIIAHAAGGIPDLLDNGKCGILVYDHSVNGYAEALGALIQDASEKQKITRNGLERVRSVYSAQQNADRHVHLYRELCCSSK